MDKYSGLMEGLDSEDKLVFNSLSENERALFFGALEDDSLIRDIANIDFKRECVPPEEFLSNPYYLGEIVWNPKEQRGLFPKWREELIHVLSPENLVTEWVLGGSLGAGKTMASLVALMYTLYRLSCLRDPHEYLNMMSNTPIEFFLFNVNLATAQDTALRQFEQLINGSPYFREHFPENKRRTRRSRKDTRDKEYFLEFPPYFSVTEGSGAQHFISRNIIAGLFDEANFVERSQKSAARFRYDSASRAYGLYAGLKNRIESRFLNQNQVFGLLCLVSSASSSADFLENHKKKVKNDPHTHISEFSQWGVKPWRYGGEIFRVFVGGRTANSRILGKNDPVPDAEGFILEVPVEERLAFDRDLGLALREKAGIPSDVLSPLIPVKEQIAEARDSTRDHPFSILSPIVGHRSMVTVAEFLIPHKIAKWEGGLLVPRYHRDKVRHIHVDLGLTNDAAGLCMGCVTDSSVSIVEDREGNKTMDYVPKVWIDLILKLSPPQKPEQIGFSKIREFIIYLRDVLHYNIQVTSFDGFQSAQLIQDLQNCGFKSELLSCDKTADPYQALRGAIMENRLSIYEYEPVETELSLLQLDVTSQRVDHLPGGSKDCSDALAGVTWHCTEQVRLQGNANLSGASSQIKNPVFNRQVGDSINLFEHPDYDWIVDKYSLY